MGGYYRGVPESDYRQRRVAAIATEMRRQNVTTGSGCRQIARAIEQRTGQEPARMTSGERRAARERAYALELLKRKERHGALTRAQEIRAWWAVNPCCQCGSTGQCRHREPMAAAAELGHPVPGMVIEPWMEVRGVHVLP